MRIARTLKLGLLLLMWNGVGAEVSNPSPRLTPSQAISIARAEAHRVKLDLSRYHAPEAEYEMADGAARWRVVYSTDAFDDCFYVYIDDHTRKPVLYMCAA